MIDQLDMPYAMPDGTFSKQYCMQLIKFSVHIFESKIAYLLIQTVRMETQYPTEKSVMILKLAYLQCSLLNMAFQSLNKVLLA